MLRPKKNSYKEVDNDKNSYGSKIPQPPPPNFSNGPSLIISFYIDETCVHDGIFSESPLDTNTQTY